MNKAGYVANLIPAAASRCKSKRLSGVSSDRDLNMRFVVWAMQIDIDDLTVERIRRAMRVSKSTAERMRRAWLELTATRFYRWSMRAIATRFNTVLAEAGEPVKNAAPTQV